MPMLTICVLPGQIKHLISVIESLDIEPYKKASLKIRYISLLKIIGARASLYSFVFFTSRLIVTVGSILVPAFLSIQGALLQDDIFLAAWILSILVSISNGLVALFKVDKKYYFIHTTLELLKSEGWQYIALTGRYGKHDNELPTHNNQFNTFFHIAEKIKMRLVEEEYWKFTDTSAATNAATNHPMDGVQTPQQKQISLEHFPEEQKAVIEGWVHAMKHKSSTSGLLPRRRTSISIPIVDGEQTPARVRRASSSVEVSVRPEMSEKTSPRATMVQLPLSTVYSQTEEIYDDAAISGKGL